MPTATPIPQPPLITLFDFATAATSGQWYIVNDGVMGGVSRSQGEIDNAVLTFSGVVSLENNGGFASIRSQAVDWQTGTATRLLLRVRGDGKLYRFQLYESVNGIAYEAFFQTVAGEWIDVTIALSDFQPTFRGRVIDRPPLNPASLSAVGIMLQDKQSGTFQIEIDSVRLR